MSETDALARLIAEHLQKLNISPSPSQSAGIPVQNTSVPTLLPTAPQQPVITGPVPRLVEVSVPVSVQLGDGRAVTVRLHFAVDGMPSLQHIVNYCSMIYGPALATYRVWGSTYGTYERRRRT
jgi:hypothetical protein